MKKTTQLKQPENTMMTEPTNMTPEEIKQIQAIILNKVKQQSKKNRWHQEQK